MSLLLAFSLDGFGKLLVFLIMLSVLIVLHEAGHFLIARRNGVRVNDFALGFGPTLVKWTSPRSGTNYRINLLPLGGYCAMQGEDGKTSEAEQQREFRAASAMRAISESDNFQAKPPLARLAIVLAGPIANLVLAYAILVAAALVFGLPSATVSTTIGPVMPGYPGAAAGLRLGDRIVAIDGVPTTDGRAMIEKIHASANVPLEIRYERNGVARDVRITPRADRVDGKIEGHIGFSTVGAYARPSLGVALAEPAVEVGDLVVRNVGGIAALIANPIARASSAHGVIGMEQAAAEVQDLGWGPYLHLAAAISVALGVFNLFPIPALDGGRAIFIVAEMLRGRPVDPEKEAFVHVTGFALLMVFMLVVAFHDIADIVAGKQML